MEIKLFDRRGILLATYTDADEMPALALAATGDRVLLPSGQKPAIYERVFDPRDNTLSLHLRSTVDPEAEGFAPATVEEPAQQAPAKKTVPAKKVAR